MEEDSSIPPAPYKYKNENKSETSSAPVTPPVTSPQEPLPAKKLYSEDEVAAMLKKSREETDDKPVTISNDIVKQLQATVGIFNALKEFSSNPLSKAIEAKVGQLGVDAIEKTFAKQEAKEPGKRDLLEMIANSQFGFGLGTGVGQRGPETIDALGRWIGKPRVDNFLDTVMGGRGGGGNLPPYKDSDQRGLGTVTRDNIGSSRDNRISGGGSNSSSSSSASKTSREEMELVLALDKNNPEHIAAYAETQGIADMSMARSMLMIHQEAFIKQIKDENKGYKQILEKNAPQEIIEPIEHEKSVSFKDKNVDMTPNGEESENQGADVKWDTSEGELSPERKREEKKIAEKKEKNIMRDHSPAVDYVKKELDAATKKNEEISKLMDVTDSDQLRLSAKQIGTADLSAIQLGAVYNDQGKSEIKSTVIEAVTTPVDIEPTPVPPGLDPLEQLEPLEPIEEPVITKAMCSKCKKIKMVQEMDELDSYGKRLRLCADCAKKEKKHE